MTDRISCHLTQDELASSALGTASPAAMEHLAGCISCQEELESYKSIVAGIRTVFSAPAPHMHVIQCQQGLMTEDHACTIDHPVTGHRLAITCHNGWLSGQLSHPDNVDVPEDATSVRLFSQRGLVGTIPVEENGSFLVRCLNTNERHSLTIVLPGDGAALQLLTGEN